MSGFIAKQPNGKYCLYSSIVDSLTVINMTKEDYINMCMEEAREDARKRAKYALEHYVKPFEKVEKLFHSHILTMTKKQFQSVLKKTKDENGEYEEL